MTDPKPNIRPGVRGICRNGFWTPVLEATNDPRWPWTCMAGWKWASNGCYYADEMRHPNDIIGIVEDLPTVPSQKPAPSNAPIYAVIYPGLATIARQHGYALAVHGSMQRDFDLIAVPWVEHPSEPDVVVKAFTTEFDLRVVGDIGHKLHHRTVYSISLSGNCAIDLSFMPTAPSSQPAPQIPGMPEGWEAVRIGAPMEGEWYYVMGVFQKAQEDHSPKSSHLICRRIKPPEPLCTWQHGVFRDGWIAEDECGQLMFYRDKPRLGTGMWECETSNSPVCEDVPEEMLWHIPKFRDDLPWSERCVKVGPEAEALLKANSSIDHQPE